MPQCGLRGRRLQNDKPFWEQNVWKLLCIKTNIAMRHPQENESSARPHKMCQSGCTSGTQCSFLPAWNIKPHLLHAFTLFVVQDPESCHSSAMFYRTDEPCLKVPHPSRCLIWHYKALLWILPSEVLQRERTLSYIITNATKTHFRCGPCAQAICWNRSESVSASGHTDMQRYLSWFPHFLRLA